MKKYLILLFAVMVSCLNAQANPNNGMGGQPCFESSYCDLEECENGRFYIGGFAGANFFKTHCENKSRIKLDPGYAGIFAAGYQYQAFRGEAEVAYRWNHIRNAHFRHIKVPLKGHARSVSFMANGYYDINTRTCFTPYVGFGVGYMTTRSHATIRRAVPDFFSANGYSYDTSSARSKSEGFAWQAIAGVSTRVYENTDLALEYRYFAGRKRVTEQNIGVSARYFF